MGILCFDASSALLCGEDRNSILCFNGDGGEEEEEEVDVEVEVVGFGLEFSVGSGFPVQSDEFIGLLVEREAEHLPGTDYFVRLGNGELDASWRSDSVDWIRKVHSYYKFGPLSVYLSVNYLDRFLSTHELPHDKSWMQQLLSVACLSLAVKMEETVVPLALDLQVCNAKYVFDARTIQRMELLVLSTLEWRMQAVTPFSFISYFLDKFNEGKPPKYALVSQCAELIVSTLKGTQFLQFRPSEIAAAAALSAVTEARILEFGNALVAAGVPVNKERVMRCYDVMQEMALVKKKLECNATSSSLLVPSVPQSPIGVLDAACLSFRSDDTTTGSHSNSSNQASPASKRGRLSTPPPI